MAHFYESSIITTKDGLQCQVYGNEHPFDSILVKPKYIPTDKIESPSLQYRFISGRKMNRLNLWSDKEALKDYLESFRQHYPQYVLQSQIHHGDRLFFAVPINQIERIFFPRKGLSELMSMPKESLDPHLNNVHRLVEFLLKSGLRVKDLGITYSTLMGHYAPDISDINIVVYGKAKFWQLMQYLETANHPLLKWKTDEDWLQFYKRRERYSIFNKEDFLSIMKRKKSEGFFNNCLFVIFAAEKEEETWFKWGEEKYTDLGQVTVQGEVTNNFDSIVRPGCYNLKESKTIKGNFDGTVKKVVFYSRDYCLLAYPRDNIEVSGTLEKVEAKNKEPYYRIVVGYFDAYVNERREDEYIKPLS